MHRDVVKGKSSENRSYVRKEGEKFNRESDGLYEYTDGLYEYTDSNAKLHKGINYIDTFEEWGDIPQEHQSSDLFHIHQNFSAAKISPLLFDSNI